MMPERGNPGFGWRKKLIGEAALIAWMLVVRVDVLVKDGAVSAVTRVFDALWRRRLRRSSILDKIINTNRVPSKRSRPLSGPSYIITAIAREAPLRPAVWAWPASSALPPARWPERSVSARAAGLRQAQTAMLESTARRRASSLSSWVRLASPSA